jgi:hypothetical protein
MGKLLRSLQGFFAPPASLIVGSIIQSMGNEVSWRSGHQVYRWRFFVQIQDGAFLVCFVCFSHVFLGFECEKEGY